MECIQAIFCCFDWKQTRNNPNQVPAPKTPPRKSRQRRLMTKFTKEQIKIVTDEDRKAGVRPVYCCPICFLHYTKILACSECHNFICLFCYKDYDRKNKKIKQVMKCPFCFSIKCTFNDHQSQAHSYFDTTKKGFLTKQERALADNQVQENSLVKLENIREEQQNRPNQNMDLNINQNNEDINNNHQQEVQYHHEENIQYPNYDGVQQNNQQYVQQNHQNNFVESNHNINQHRLQQNIQLQHSQVIQQHHQIQIINVQQL